MSGERWQELLHELAEREAPRILEEARAGARLRARAVLEDALVDEILSAITRPAPAATPGPAFNPGLAIPEPAATAEPEAVPQPTATPAPAGEAWWVYCVLRSADADEAGAALTGVEPGSAVEAVVEDDLAALASRVPLPEYGDEQLRLHLEHIEWLERTARAHEAVQRSVMARADLVPVRLCTLYRDRAAVRRVLRENAGLFADNLALVQGCSEWGVKVFVELERQARPSAPPPTQASSGTDYLTGRQRERELALAADELSATCAQEVHVAVSALARGDRVNPAQRPETHGREAEMILNGAYLVEDGQVAELQSTVQQLGQVWAASGMLVELTGPWPPYNFVTDSAGMIS